VNPPPDLPARVVLSFHERCGARIESDGWCDRCETTPLAEEYLHVEYVRTSDHSATAE
jgi:hypothetical protein